MANEELLDELDEEQLEGEGGATGAKKPKLRLIILVVVALLLAGAAGFYFMQGGAVEDEVAAKEDVESKDNAKVEALATPYYFSLNPPFVVNFVGKGRANFLQVNIDGLTRNPTVKEDITTHLPHIRNNVVFLLSSKRYDDLITPEGKEQLRKQVLEEIRNILTQETGNGDVEDIYFTSFVMQ